MANVARITVATPNPAASHTWPATAAAPSMTAAVANPPMKRFTGRPSRSQRRTWWGGCSCCGLPGLGGTCGDGFPLHPPRFPLDGGAALVRRAARRRGPPPAVDAGVILGDDVLKRLAGRVLEGDAPAGPLAE